MEISKGSNIAGDGPTGSTGGITEPIWLQILMLNSEEEGWKEGKHWTVMASCGCWKEVRPWNTNNSLYEWIRANVLTKLETIVEREKQVVE